MAEGLWLLLIPLFHTTSATTSVQIFPLSPVFRGWTRRCGHGHSLLVQLVTSLTSGVQHIHGLIMPFTHEINNRNRPRKAFRYSRILRALISNLTSGRSLKKASGRSLWQLSVQARTASGSEPRAPSVTINPYTRAFAQGHYIRTARWAAPRTEEIEVKG